MRRKAVNAKKRRQVERLLRNPKWRTRSTNWIAQQTGLSWLFVDKVRTQMTEDSNAKRFGKDGKEYPRDGRREHHGRNGN